MGQGSLSSTTLPMCALSHRSMAINEPGHELGHYLMTYAAGQNPSTFTGVLPPAAAQVRPVQLASPSCECMSQHKV